MSDHLILFFTRGISLRTWAMMGMLQRELAVYKLLIERGIAVSFITYGDARDLEYASELGGIEVLCNQWDLNHDDYAQRLTELHSGALSSATVIKTNQTYGSELALRAARLFDKPLIARCGYMWSNNAAREYGYDSPQAVLARETEETVFGAADRVVVTTPAMHADVLSRVAGAEPKTSVIPNYVDTDRFRPLQSVKESNSLIFVGRIAPEKNLASLLEAVAPLDATLTLIGEGRLRPELQTRFSSPDGKVKWEGNVPNHDLPVYMNKAQTFVLPSLYEGHPKALIEAMACGLAVIGADSQGIREIIRHEENGLLCGTDAAGLRQAIQRINGDAELRITMGENARHFVWANYALKRIIELEIAVIRQVTA